MRQRQQRAAGRHLLRREKAVVGSEAEAGTEEEATGMEEEATAAAAAATAETEAGRGEAAPQP
jgi:hypothetical protein